MRVLQRFEELHGSHTRRKSQRISQSSVRGVCFDRPTSRGLWSLGQHLMQQNTQGLEGSMQITRIGTVFILRARRRGSRGSFALNCFLGGFVGREMVVIMETTLGSRTMYPYPVGTVECVTHQLPIGTQHLDRVANDLILFQSERHTNDGAVVMRLLPRATRSGLPNRSIVKEIVFPSGTRLFAGRGRRTSGSAGC